MALDLSQPAPATRLAYYPGFQPAEALIWDRYLDRFAEDYTGFLYNVRVGQSWELPPNTEDNYRKFWEAVGRTRIDVIGLTAEDIIVIEVKQNAGHAALGQALAGEVLVREETEDPRPVRSIIVTNQARPDTKTVAPTFGLDVIEV